MDRTDGGEGERNETDAIEADAGEPDAGEPDAGEAIRGGRYRYVEYTSSGGRIGIIQDTKNEEAWLESTKTVAVER